jgi:hypothetical protein
MATSYFSTNVMSVVTMMMVLMIFLSMCETFDNVVASSTDSIFQRKRTTVTIKNQLGNGKTLQIECESGSHDHLAQYDIIPGANYSFSFRPNLSKSTKFTCRFTWDIQNDYVFKIYVYDRDHKVCSACLWDILTTGPCEYNYDTLKYDLCHSWNE